MLIPPDPPSPEPAYSPPAYVLGPPRVPRPRVWTALLIGPLAIIAAIFLAGIIVAVALVALGGIQSVLGASSSTEVLEKLTSHPLGILLLVLPGQLTFLGAAVGAALLSPHPLRPRLGLVRTALPWWTIPLLGLATMFFGAIGGMIVENLFPGPQEHLEIFIKMARMPNEGMFIVNVALLSMLPGLTEELLFRGYVQRRLLQRWPAAAAIAVSTLIFALGHAEPLHILSVLPVGAWLGIVAWRCGSVWPGMFCHAAMNALSFTSMRFGDPYDHAITPPLLIFLAISAAAVVGSFFFLKRYAATSFTSGVDL